MNNRLRVLRAERDWSQGDLADRLDVSRQSVNAIETGRYDLAAARLPDRRTVRLTIEDVFTNPSKEPT